MSRMETATKLAYGLVELDDAARAKSKERLESDGLLAGVDTSTCWYCGKEKASHELAAPLTRPAKATQGLEHFVVAVPACQSCRDLLVSRKTTAGMLMNGILVPFSGGGFLLGLTAAKEMYEKDGLSPKMLFLPFLGLLMGLGLSFFLAAYVVTAVCASRFKRADSLRDPREYPPIRELHKEGWQGP